MSRSTEIADSKQRALLEVGDAISLHVESHMGGAHMEGSVSVVGRHHLKVQVKEGSIPTWLSAGDTVRIRYAQRPGFLPLTSRLSRVDSQDRHTLVLALPEGKMTANRRNFVRTDVEISCVLFTLSGLHISGETVNISGGGMCLRIPGKLSVRANERIMVGLEDTTEDSIPHTLFSRIVRLTQSENYTEMGMEFVDLETRARDALCRFVMLCEIRSRRFEAR